MRITDLLKRAGLNQVGNQAGNQVAGSDGSRVAEREGGEAKEGTAVKVSISPLAQKLAQASAILNDEDAQRKLRVDTLKAKIERGEYAVSSEEVARSMLSYSKDE